MLTQPQLAQLASSLPIPAFVLTRSGRCVQAFGCDSHYSGFYPAPSITAIFSPNKAPWLLTQIDHALASGKPHQVEFALSEHDWQQSRPRHSSWWQGHLSPLNFQVDGEAAVLWLSHDVTHYHQQALRWANYGEVDLVSHLYSQRRMNKELAAHFSLFHRHHIPCSLVMFELDYFNQLRQQCGETTEACVVSTVGNVCLSDLRQEDQAFRYQQNSFVILLPHTETEQAWALIDRLRKDIHQRLLSLDLPQACTSISGGLSQFADDDQRSQDLLNRASQGLAAAKALGCNRICVEQLH
ncbi:GGDEF domain-containing protein [Shewanella sp.]|uniref:GGDEF domain-containing protein n=1 Tax=Shewanella sp. TaxID=50422 RepID=UPI003A973102